MTYSTAIRARAVLLATLGVTIACSDGATLDPPLHTGGASVGGDSGGGSSSGGGMITGGSAATGGVLSAGGTSSGGSPLGSGGEGAGGGGMPPYPACPGNSADAYQGMVVSLPGTLQAEDFDPDGYQDDSAGNEGGAYRPDVDVDIKELGEGYAVGWMNAGEWLEYTVYVDEPGRYTVSAVGAAVQEGRTLEISSCGQALAQVDVPTVSDWGDMASVEVSLDLAAGLQVLRVTVGAQNEIDLDALHFARGAAGTGGAPGTGGESGAGGAPGTGGEAMGTGGELGEIPRFVGNITTFNQIDTEGLVYSDYWDQITPENTGKWGSIQRSATSAPDWTALDAIYDYTLEKGIVFKQHAFIWGTQQPSGNISESDVRNWIQTFCERYPATRLIDVVNEPPPHTTPSYTDAIGGGTNGNWQWITNAFIWARESCPNAILILNDFNNIEWSGDNQHFINITNTVLENGGPIDALGAQAHDLDHGSVSFQTVQQLLNKLHNDTGLPVYITEMDPSYTDDQAQLRIYEQYMPYFLDQDFVPGITIWGWIYGRTWSQAPNSGLVRDGNPRPAMTWLMNELGRPVP